MQEITRSSPMTLVDSFTASRIARTWAIRLQSPDGKGKAWKVLKHDLKNDILNEPTVYTVDICRYMTNWIRVLKCFEWFFEKFCRWSWHDDHCWSLMMTVGSIPHPLHPSARLLPPKTSCKCLRPGSGSRSIPSMKSWNFKTTSQRGLWLMGEHWETTSNLNLS